jgi:hypothetical protein
VDVAATLAPGSFRIDAFFDFAVNASPPALRDLPNPPVNVERNPLERSGRPATADDKEGVGVILRLIPSLPSTIPSRSSSSRLLVRDRP